MAAQWFFDSNQPFCLWWNFWSSSGSLMQNYRESWDLNLLKRLPGQSARKCALKSITYITRKSHKKQVTALGILIHKSEALLLPLPMDMCRGSPAGWTSLASDSGVGSGKGASSSSMMLMLTK